MLISLSSSGTITGIRIVRVDKKEVLRTGWLLKLEGTETFQIGRHQCVIRIQASGSFDYEYSLEVDGKSFEKFTEHRSKISRTWIFNVDGQDCRAVLEKDTLNFWINGQMIEEDPEFSDEGTETHFEVNGHVGCLKAMSTGYHRLGINYTLLIDGIEVPGEGE